MVNLHLFFIASLLLNLTPGNDMLYVISRSLSQGFKGGMYSAIGIFLGCFVHVLAALLGLSIIIAKSAFIFGAVKFAGAGYLIYLGISALIAKSDFTKQVEQEEKIEYNRLVKQGIIINAFNPKVAIFFISFLPQFINFSGSNVQLNLLLLGLWFAVQGTFILIVVAYLVGSTRKKIHTNQTFWKIQQKLTGIILIGLGIRIALTARN